MRMFNTPLYLAPYLFMYVAIAQVHKYHNDQSNLNPLVRVLYEL